MIHACNSLYNMYISFYIYVCVRGGILRHCGTFCSRLALKSYWPAKVQTIQSRALNALGFRMAYLGRHGLISTLLARVARCKSMSKNILSVWVQSPLLKKTIILLGSEHYSLGLGLGNSLARGHPLIHVRKQRVLLLLGIN